MTQSLTGRTKQGIRWSFAGSLGQQFLQFGIGILIARRLAPGDFGLMGMIAVFFEMSRSLADGGYASALVQKRDSDDIDASTVFYVNCLLSVALACVLCLAARSVSVFFGQPVLEHMMYWLSLGPILVALGRVQGALLVKKMDFRSQFVVSVGATFAGGSTGLMSAYFGMGVWSLVAMSLVTEFSRTALYWFRQQWRPSTNFSLASLKEMSRLGLPLMGSNLIGVVINQMHGFAIGKLYTKEDVGFFSRGRTLHRLPVASLTNAIGNVSFPAFVEIHDQPQRLVKAVRKTLRITAFIVLPIIALLAGCSHSLVHVLLTEKWQGTVIYLRALSVAEVLLPLTMINLNIIKACGESGHFFRIAIAKQLVMAASLLVTCRFGLLAIVAGLIVASFINFWINARFAAKRLGYGCGRQLHDVFPFFLGSVAAGIASFSIEFAPIKPILILTLQILVGSLVYLAFSWYIAKEELLTVWDEIKLRIASGRFSR
jgi:O-antigen/teichoic acid export membrane protein